MTSIPQAKIPQDILQWNRSLSRATVGFEGRRTEVGVLHVLKAPLDQLPQVEGLGPARLGGESVEPGFCRRIQPHRRGHVLRQIGAFTVVLETVSWMSRGRQATAKATGSALRSSLQVTPARGLRWAKGKYLQLLSHGAQGVPQAGRQ